MRFLIFLFFISIVFSHASKAQCSNTIKLKQVEHNRDNNNLGSIEINVQADGGFKCTLYIESGSGQVEREVKRGSGNSSIKFEGLDVNFLYKVVVEFNSGDKDICKTLQLSGIYIE